jgi:hypothetical protein
MKSPFETSSATFNNSAFCETAGASPTHVMNFAEQYENPWLIPSLITRGCRTERKKLRNEIAQQVLDRNLADADEAASLCVKAYGMLGEGAEWNAIEEMLHRFEPHVAMQDWSEAKPIEVRWGVSLTYVGALLALESGQRELAKQLLEECIAIPFLGYAPLLATKTIGAALLRAKLALVDEGVDSAKTWLRRGAEAAEQAVTQDWTATFGDLTAQPLPAFRELAEVMELGSQCVAGLTLLSSSAPTADFYDLLSTNRSVEIERLLSYQTALGEAITWHQQQMRALQGGVEFWQAQTNVANQTIQELQRRQERLEQQIQQLSVPKPTPNPIAKQYQKLRNSLLKRVKRQV